MKTYGFDSSSAFVERCEIGPHASGVLDGLAFAVKDNIDLCVAAPPTAANRGATRMTRRVSRGMRRTTAGGRCALRSALELCEALYQRVAGFTRPGDVFCYATAPVLAPKKGTLTDANLAAVLDYYDRTMTVTAFAGVARLPEVGLSLAAAHCQDEFLLDACARLWHSLTGQKRSVQLRREVA